MHKDILSLPLQPEGQKLEYKYVVPPPKSLARLIASFANSEGGKIVFGVKERPDGTLSVVGVPMDLPDWAIVQPAFEFLRTRPLISYSLEDIAGKRVLIINIQKSSTPILVEDNLHFIRKGTKTELVKPPVNQIKEDEGKYPNTNKVRQLIAELRQSKQQGTESKINLLEHFTALFNLTVHLKFIFYDEKVDISTNRTVESNVLIRLITSSLVDTFEKYLADLILEIYLSEPKTLKSTSTVTIEDVLKCQTMEEFVRFEAERRVSKLAHGNLASFIELFKRSYNIEIFTISERPFAEELFEIRHLYTHRNGRVDTKFLKMCPATQLQVGQEHQMTFDELCKAAKFLLVVLNRIDQEAITKYYLNSPDEDSEII